MSVTRKVLIGCLGAMTVLAIIVWIRSHHTSSPTRILPPGTKVTITPQTRGVKDALAFDGQALLFKDSFYAYRYLRCRQKGDFGCVGGLLTPPVLMFPVNHSMKATVVKYVAEGDGPSQVELDLDALPPNWDRKDWKQWQTCWVFNECLIADVTPQTK